MEENLSISDSQLTKSPKVSVLMPVFNAGPLLKEAVYSILRQTFNDFELLIVNDGSTDGCLAFIEKILDPRIRIFNFHENVGLICALNKGVELARGELIARMDADDVSRPDRLEKQVRAFEQFPSLALLGTWARYVDGSGRPFGELKPPQTRSEIIEQILRWNCFIHPTVMMRTQSVRELGGYPADAIHAEDYSLWLRFVASHDVANLGEFLLDYRVHPGQVSQRKVVDQLRTARRLQIDAEIRYGELGLTESQVARAHFSLWRRLRGLNGTVGDVYAGWARLYGSMGDRRLSVSTALAGLWHAPLGMALYAVLFSPILERKGVRAILGSRVVRSILRRMAWYETRISSVLFGDSLE